MPVARSSTPGAPRRRNALGEAPDAEPNAEDKTKPKAPAHKTPVVGKPKVFPKFCFYLILMLLCLFFLAILFHSLWAYGDDIRNLLTAVTRFRKAKAVDEMLGWRSGATLVLTRKRR